ncbi:phenylacetic acid degradation bifunctional protein PaaZ [Sulfitobacter geojensis]|uniref:Phenylacetic acid degradation bifunctional protein PaaZ n=1 Tax=Sulfitobacter geojensis TaxID=1342299 RepID=A0AAE2VY03_9RHOB|nr:phenylacetic acid degradation bifunctional protein PaaZ [Sulfitobacter geojensis]MBM1689317.1 phenylacetic acid degradation bifunctional protein PaaZ [Sulfitobacter geojensis]MBM1693383.1 phenylacetic acid degradation bifunctional protein PaaZ [Sulfitobacter geojensis]MBM1705549.1 phenylacetic acid degradation bifunctional protein PaaZ [Sulfitobacter geojensis]MBM1709607.1 phenylacetic acid degradation bifunctional protein PaaZ [Sulfitobacter geojensis]MBM1713673.1 phenylacetic acid degrada
MLDVQSFAAGQWLPSSAGARNIASAITGEVIAQAGNDALDVQAMLGYARDVGGPALRKLTFHDRARMLKAVALYLMERKQVLYDLSYDTGATLSDHKIDVDGGIGTMMVFASKGRREMPDGHVFLDGPPEQLGRTGAFMGRHICTPLQGVAVHINAFNFPVWGMLEKLAPTLLAGVPAIVKPATATSYVTEACVRMMLESGLLPKGALQLVSGGLGDMLDHLDCQDAVAFTGSADTALMLRSNPKLMEHSVRFASEQDSLNASVLGPDAVAGTPEFDLFVKEVQREMTAKAGQKCTAIRRIMVPEAQIDAVIAALGERLAKTTIGDPRLENTRMGALVSAGQKRDVLEKAALIGEEAECVFGNIDDFSVEGADKDKGAFVPPMLFHCVNPDTAERVHDTEAFGPVSTVMPYRDLPHAIDLLNKGKGSLVASIITNDGDVAREVTLGSAAFHGRLYFNNRTSMSEATGHGAPLPHMVHGGPGRAGGGEELGGIRGVMHYMQRTAVQGSPDILTAIGKQWVPGAHEINDRAHPFTRTFNDIELGETFNSPSREITLEDIETFAHFTGDTFYAHMDDEAAKANPFFPGRVAHGYLLLSFAAGLFVQPDPGPVLANTGLDNLRFMAPVAAGDSIRVRLTVKHKTPRNDEYGEVRWHVTLYNQNDEVAAEYELLTMNAY